MKKRNFPLYKIFVYVALITLAISIIVPIAWVFLASLKSQLELVSGNPFDFPKQMLWSNFVDAFVKARMGDYLLNTIIVTALSLVILLVVALPASYVLARFDFAGKKFFHFRRIETFKFCIDRSVTRQRYKMVFLIKFQTAVF